MSTPTLLFSPFLNLAHAVHVLLCCHTHVSFHFKDQSSIEITDPRRIRAGAAAGWIALLSWLARLLAVRKNVVTSSEK